MIIIITIIIIMINIIIIIMMIIIAVCIGVINTIGSLSRVTMVLLLLTPCELWLRPRSETSTRMRSRVGVSCVFMVVPS